MSTPYVGEIRLVGFNFAPAAWALCDGSLLPISEYSVVFDLIGTTYGGDGVTSFGLPDLRGRTPIHQGTGGGETYTMGETGGVESVTLTVAQLPAHKHAINAQASNGNSSSPQAAYFAGSSAGRYASSSNALTASVLQNVGGSMQHENRMPFVCATYIISLFGIFPSQN